MQLQLTGASLLLSALLPGLAAATGFDCAHINVEGYKYDLSSLDGVHELYHVKETENWTTNTTYVLNICNILHKAANRPEGKCGTSRNICGFVNEIPKDGNGGTSFGFPIVGLDHAGAGSKDPKFTRLDKIDENMQGVRVELGGGEYTGDHNDEKAKDASAQIDFQCDPDRSGLEGLNTRDDPKERRDEGDSTRGRSLEFKSFDLTDDDKYLLKLEWKTRYACDDYQRGKNGSSGWGFFTWLIIILFFAIATYLIFGSWLNYNRYGARGWDLLPHADTLRDVPYIFQDWVKRVINTLQGSSSRGGYSAV